MSKENNSSQEFFEEPLDASEVEVAPRGRRYRRREDSDHYEEEREHRPRRRRAWPWLFGGCAGGVLLVILVIAASIFVVANNTSGSGLGGPPAPTSATYTQPQQQSIPITTLTQLRVHNVIGSITIIMDPKATAAMVSTVKKVKATSSAAANKEFGRISIQVTATPTGSLTVSVTLPGSSSNILDKNSDTVDVTITLPPGVTTNTTGSPLTLNTDTSKGNVLLNNISGMLLVNAGLGTVTIHQAILAAGSHLAAGTGDVIFDGSLDTTHTTNVQSMFKMQAEKGNVDVTLPATTNVTLDANVNVGMIKSEFGIKVMIIDGSPSYFGPLLTNP